MKSIAAGLETRSACFGGGHIYSQCAPKRTAQNADFHRKPQSQIHPFFQKFKLWKAQETTENCRFFRAGFRQNGFFADFYFWAAGFFRGFSRRILSPHFCGKKCPEKSSRKIPGKILQNLYNKNPPTHFCRLPRARFLQKITDFRRKPQETADWALSP